MLVTYHLMRITQKTLCFYKITWRANERKENKWIMNVEWCDSVQLNKHDKLTFILFENVIYKNQRIVNGSICGGLSSRSNVSIW